MVTWKITRGDEEGPTGQEDVSLAGMGTQQVSPLSFFEVSLSEGCSSIAGGHAPFEPVAELEEVEQCATQMTLDVSEGLVRSRSGVDPAAGAQPRTQDGENAADLTEQRIASMARMKSFCASILKKLAPPLLREVEAASTLRPEAEPFTPRRSCRLATTADRKSVV